MTRAEIGGLLAVAMLLAILLAGCAPHFSTLVAGTSDGVTCTEWAAIHPIAGTTTFVTCRDETGKFLTAPSAHTAAPIPSLMSEIESVI